MFVSIYYKPSLFNAHTMVLIVHIFMNVNKLCINQMEEVMCQEKYWNVQLKKKLSLKIVSLQYIL